MRDTSLRWYEAGRHTEQEWPLTERLLTIGCGLGSGPRVLEDIVQRHVEYLCELKGKLERRRVTPLLNGNDSLSSNADSICQSSLSHLSVLEPKHSNPIGYAGWLHHC